MCLRETKTEKGEIAAASSYAWPSVVVYKGATVIKRQTIVNCDWSDNVGALLEKSFFCGHVLYHGIMYI